MVSPMSSRNTSPLFMELHARQTWRERRERKERKEVEGEVEFEVREGDDGSEKEGEKVGGDGDEQKGESRRGEKDRSLHLTLCM